MLLLKLTLVGLIILLIYLVYPLFKKDGPNIVSTIISPEGYKIGYSEWYSIEICPKCEKQLDGGKARYTTKCCYLCAHQNGELFNTTQVIQRDKYLNGKWVETEIKPVLK